MPDKKTALIIGGSRGIGRAISVRLARDGYHVIINFKTNLQQAQMTQTAITESGGSCALYPFDITDRQATMAALEDVTAHTTVFLLVFCAGIRKDELLVFMSPEQWDSVLATNLGSYYNVVKPVVKHMMLNRSGRIVIISSTSGESGLPGQVNYSAAKAGLIGATKALARECAKRNVLANVVTPGFITTDMTAQVNEKELAKTVPLGRFGTPEEVAGLVSFLATDDAGYITGQVIGVNGGVYM